MTGRRQTVDVLVSHRYVYAACSSCGDGAHWPIEAHEQPLRAFQVQHAHADDASRCTVCGGPKQDSDDRRASGYCLRCLCGPVPGSASGVTP